LATGKKMLKGKVTRGNSAPAAAQGRGATNGVSKGFLGVSKGVSKGVTLGHGVVGIKAGLSKAHKDRKLAGGGCGVGKNVAPTQKLATPVPLPKARNA
jgi:hypothetical protein